MMRAREVDLFEEIQTSDGRRRRHEYRGNLEQLEADRALYERLQAAEFVGRETDKLREDLWVYGWKVLRAWMRDGTIQEKCGERDIVIPIGWHETEVLRRRGDIRDEIAHDAVQAAVVTFVDEYLPAGRWDPHKGAGMRTYFTVTCLLAFRDRAKKWARKYRKELLHSGHLATDSHLAGRGLPPDEQAIYRFTIQRILATASLEARAICGLIYEHQISQKEIADHLGMTSRAVEGHMRRLRLQAKALTTRGEIEALYGRLSTASAGAR
jgi:DNA-directed RNA polymerase specialized sigma24 family protein